MSVPALDIDALSFALHGQSILSNVSVRIGEGEMWSIIGANGAGKSSLLKCLMRIHTGWSGRALLHGREMATLSQRQLASQVAYVPQPGGDQRFPCTVQEFIHLGRYPYSGPFGTAHVGDAAAIESAMRRADVESFAHRTLATLSGGERQKVFIAAALAQECKVLLLDEPTAFLDYRHQSEVACLIRSLHCESGATILNVTHDVNAAILAGGHVLALRQGEVAWIGPAADLACENTLALIFDAKFRFLEDPVTGLLLVAPQCAEALL